MARFLVEAGSVSISVVVAGWPSGAGASGDRVLNRRTSRRWKGALPHGLGSVICVGRSNPGEARHPGQTLSRPQGVHPAPRRGSAPRRLPHTRLRLKVGWNRLAARSARGARGCSTDGQPRSGWGCGSGTGRTTPRRVSTHAAALRRQRGGIGVARHRDHGMPAVITSDLPGDGAARVREGSVRDPPAAWDSTSMSPGAVRARTVRPGQCGVPAAPREGALPAPHSRARCEGNTSSGWCSSQSLALTWIWHGRDRSSIITPGQDRQRPRPSMG